jgi:hypothetical protein
MLVELSEVPDDRIGTINEALDVYVQKCSACGTMNFTVSEDAPVKMCCNCHKARIASVLPVKYQSQDPAAQQGGDDADAQDDAGVDAYTAAAADDEDDEDASDSADWSRLLGSITQEEPGASADEKVILVMEGDGNFSYEIKKQEVPVLLGRSAALGEILANDLRVSNEHCYIDFANGRWVVLDNHSANGTAVNSMDIGDGGKKILRSGDVIKMGHNRDSIEFKVMMEE